MGNIREILKEKVARLKAAVSLEHHDRVPIIGQADFWPVTYTEKYTMQEAFYSIDVLAQCYREAFSKWNEWDAFDTIMHSLGPILDATGSRRLKVPGRDLSPQAEFQHPDLCLMEAEEYEELIIDPIKFQIEKIIPRLCKRVGSDNPSVRLKALGKTVIFLGQWVEKAKYYGSLWSQEYGIPPMLKGAAIYTPMDYIADKLRGFYQGIIDIKERPEEVQEACEALLPFLMSVGVPPGMPGGDYPLLFNPQHVSPFLSPKDYEKVYWPTFKKMIDHFVGKDHRLWVFFESNQEQHLERIQDLPKGKIVAHLESTDLEKAKEVLGGRICIAGGMPARLLARGTPEDVIAQTKSVLKIFQDEPGFIMTCDTTIPVSAKPENINAWLDAVKKYGHIGMKDGISRSDQSVLKDSANISSGVFGKDTPKTGPADKIPIADWEAVKNEFGKIEGDESIIKESWEDLEKHLPGLIYWLVK